jgi:hypothetical protein
MVFFIKPIAINIPKVNVKVRITGSGIPYGKEEE